MRLNYITNLPLDQTSGGWSGINNRVYKELIRYFEANYVGPVSPEVLLTEKVISKVRRIFGLRGNFYFYSNSRLEKISRLVADKLNEVQFNFFFGQTPWILCNFSEPYFVYMDADFKTYLNIFSHPGEFLRKDIMRIQDMERKWLQGAARIFVGSQWAWDQMKGVYDLCESKKKVVFLGGNIAVPSEDLFGGGLKFLFISLDFKGKGGHICFDVFKKIKATYSEAELFIIGEKPPENILEFKGVNYVGILNKNIDKDRATFINILSKSFFLIHPTKMDTMGAVIVEAGYYGCPAIAPKSFGIPELIVDNETGFLIDCPQEVDVYYQKIVRMIENRSAYLEMRRKVRQLNTNERTYDRMGKGIQSTILSCLTK